MKILSSSSLEIKINNIRRLEKKIAYLEKYFN